MGTEQRNLIGQEALDKLRHLAAKQTAMLCTADARQHVIARPMATQGMDPDGTLWFFTRRDHEHVAQIEADPRVKLLYSKESSSEYLALDGVAALSRDQQKIDELWTAIAKTWFPDGKDDPHLLLIAVVPKRAHYWDTKHGAAAQLLGMALGALTGKETDDSVEGDLSA